VLLIPGDLTFNGEMFSLLEVRESLNHLRDAGIRIFVIPGNHDIESAKAKSYLGDETVQVATVSQDDFRQLMGIFGPNVSLYKDSASLSYMAELAEGLWLLALDANTPGYRCMIRPETISWMKEVLEEADRRGVRVISMSHQNVLPQSEAMTKGFVLNNADEVKPLLKEHHVLFHLSGHSHLQHVSSEDELRDICIQSLSLTPLRYGVFTVSEDRNAYDLQMHELGILKEEADEAFAATVRRMVLPTLNEEIPAGARKRMLDFAVLFNKAYFSADRGRINQLSNGADLELWKIYAGDSFWYRAMEQVFAEYAGEEA
jgi:3',5'-cyclic AMP phosphodiesterase CpdA